jgi:hypothetical protein
MAKDDTLSGRGNWSPRHGKKKKRDCLRNPNPPQFDIYFVSGRVFCNGALFGEGVPRLRVRG